MLGRLGQLLSSFVDLLAKMICFLFPLVHSDSGVPRGCKAHAASTTMQYPLTPLFQAVWQSYYASCTVGESLVALATRVWTTIPRMVDSACGCVSMYIESCQEDLDTTFSELIYAKMKLENE